MASNNGGPWGSGPRGGGGNDDGRNTEGSGDNRGPGNRRPGGEGPQIPEIDEIVKKGQEQLRLLLGGRGGGNNNGSGPTGGSGGPNIGRGTVGLIGIAVVGAWLFSSFYTVKPEEQSVELFLGKYSSTGGPGLNFAPWPLVTAEILPVTREQTEEIGVGGNSGRMDQGLMLTTDENIVDIDFEVVWNINDPAKYLFNLRDPRQTIRAVSESAMREVIARSELAPILNRDRGSIATSVQELIQLTLNSYDSGVNIVRLNLDKADPPREVIDAFREVQAAEQTRDTLQRQADAYANQALAGARGQAAELLEVAEGYRAQVVNDASGEASRFSAVLEEYLKAPDVTRKRLYLETMESVLGRVDKIILDDQGGAGGQGVVPYLPLTELKRNSSSGSN